MNEIVYNFGQENVLCGTLTSPEHKNNSDSLPCFILLNAGLVNQAGPFRLHAELSRELAKHNFHTLRFDLSGIGDSLKHRDSRPHDEQIAGDIANALDLVTDKTGIEKFVLMGICTGADNTHKATLADSRVIGAIMIDGYVYKTLGYHFRHLCPRIFNPSIGYQWLKRLLTPTSSTKSDHSVTSNLEQKLVTEKEVYYWELPPKQAVLADLKNFIERQVNQVYIFTDNWSWSFNHKNQFHEMYKQVDFKELATCVYFDQADHIYTLVRDREKLINTVCDWADKTYTHKK